MFRRETSEQLEILTSRCDTSHSCFLVQIHFSKLSGQCQLLPAIACSWIRIDNRHDFLLCFWFGFCLLAKRTWLFIALYHFMLLSDGMWQRRLSDMCKAFYGLLVCFLQSSKIGFKLSVSVLRWFKIQMIRISINQVFHLYSLQFRSYVRVATHLFGSTRQLLLQQVGRLVDALSSSRNPTLT